MRTWIARHLVAGVLPDTARRMTIHAADCHAGTGGSGTEAAGDLT